MSNSDRPLRQILAADAVLCFATGVVLALAASQLVRMGDLPSGAAWPLRVAGVALAALGVALHRLSRADRFRLDRFTPWSIEADGLWVLGSLVVAASVEMNGAARAVVVAQAVAVAVAGGAKLVTLRRLRGRSLDASETVAVPR